MTNILIDTNIYIEVFKNNKKVTHLLQTVDHIGISTITIGELLFGFRNGTKLTENKKELDEYCKLPRLTIYEIDSETADCYSSIKYQLKTDGKPIPTDDIWIAATAMQHGLSIFSFDKHFQNIKGIYLVDS